MVNAPTAFLEAPAKLNLCLDVGPRRADGYHPLRTLMVALHGLCDHVTVSPAATRRVSCDGVDEHDNLAWRALDELSKRVRQDVACEVVIQKRIPMQAGLGGGSSDAAAALLGANHVLGLGLSPAELEDVAAAVGSDVPFFIRGGVQWARGRGELLSPATCPPFAAVIVQAGEGLSTAAVYRAFDELPPNQTPRHDTVPRTFPELVTWMGNDLWPAALQVAPSLAGNAERLRAAGADGTLLCGSGSAVAGLFATVADAAAAAAALADVVAVVTPRVHAES